MATILIVEDRPIDRKLLATIVRTGGHDVVEASDGDEALAKLRENTVDLVISDILMPTIDGFELVRRMREQRRTARTPIVFYTATYHEQEARALATRAGVAAILTKPSLPRAVLATIRSALESNVVSITDVASRGFDREHIRVMTTALSGKINRLDAGQEQLKALAGVLLRLISENDTEALIATICMEARRLTLAHSAVVAVIDEPGKALARIATSGFPTTPPVKSPLPRIDSPVLRGVLKHGRTVRESNPTGAPSTLGLPADVGAVSSLLIVPLVSSSKTVGWLSVQNKITTDQFSDNDEAVLTMLGAHGGQAYENLQVVSEARARLAESESEVRRIPERLSGARDEERLRLSRMLHDECGQLLAALKMDATGLQDQFERLSAGSTSEAKASIAAMLARIDDLIRSLRAISSELRPGVLEAIGFPAALEWQCAEFSRRSGVRCRVRTQGRVPELDATRSTSIIRIVQEALNNVRQHARATEVVVDVRVRESRVTVSIADNGRGIPAAAVKRADALGLMGMRERAELLRGRVEIRRRRRGTVVLAAIPFGHDDTIAASGA